MAVTEEGQLTESRDSLKIGKWTLETGSSCFRLHTGKESRGVRSWQGSAPTKLLPTGGQDQTRKLNVSQQVSPPPPTP